MEPTSIPYVYRLEGFTFASDDQDKYYIRVCINKDSKRLLKRCSLSTWGGLRRYRKPNSPEDNITQYGVRVPLNCRGVSIIAQLDMRVDQILLLYPTGKRDIEVTSPN